MNDYDRTPFEYLSIEPYSLLDAIAAGFEDGLHPELRRLMHQLKVAAQHVQAANIITFPARLNAAGPSAKPQIHPSECKADNVAFPVFGKTKTLTNAKRQAPK